MISVTTLLVVLLALLCPTSLKLHNLKDVGLVIKPLFGILIEEGLKIYQAHIEAQAKKAETKPAEATTEA